MEMHLPTYLPMHLPTYLPIPTHFFIQEIGTIHIGLLKHPMNLLYQGNLNYSYAFTTNRARHNFRESFFDILSAVFIACCVLKTCKKI